MGHVFSVASGFGLRVIPKSPFRFTISDEPSELDVEHQTNAGWLFARVVPDKLGGYKSKISEITESLFEVVDVVSGPDFDHWHLETHLFAFELPYGFMAQSFGNPGDGPFDLLGPHESLIFSQIVRDLPPVRDLCAPNQTILSTGRSDSTTWAELSYAHQGITWFQRLEVFGRSELSVVFTAQAPEKHKDCVKQALESICQTIKFE